MDTLLITWRLKKIYIPNLVFLMTDRIENNQKESLNQRIHFTHLNVPFGR